jgi:HAD superfamily hydrolase (TIGR01509 family)
MTKIIFFDIGGVVIKEDMKEIRRVFCKKAGVDQEIFKKYIKKNLNKSLTGKLDATKFFRDLCLETGKPKSNSEAMKKIWNKLFEKKRKIDRKIIRLIKKLRKNYKVGTLTNVTKLTYAVNKKMKIYDSFELKILSFKEGCVKSQKKIYDVLIKKVGKKVMPEEILFIDDDMENLKIAGSKGIKTIHYKNFKQLKSELLARDIK